MLNVKVRTRIRQTRNACPLIVHRFSEATLGYKSRPRAKA